MTAAIANDPWLSESQLERLTKRKQPNAQANELARAGVPFRMIAGRPVVLVQDLSAMQKSEVSRPQVRKL